MSEDEIDWEREVDAYRATSSRQVSTIFGTAPGAQIKQTISSSQSVSTSYHRPPNVAPPAPPRSPNQPPLPSPSHHQSNHAKANNPPPIPYSTPHPPSPIPTIAAPPSTSTVSSMLAAAASGLGSVMSELKSVYKPFPAFGQTAQAAPAPRERIRVIVTANQRPRSGRSLRSARMSTRYGDESKQLSPLIVPSPSSQSIHTLPTSRSATVIGSAASALTRAASMAVSMFSDEKEVNDELDDEYPVNESPHSEEEDEEDEGHRFERSWLEFVEPNSGQKLYHNLMTGEISWDRPAQFMESTSPSHSRADRDRASSRLSMSSHVVEPTHEDDLSELTALPSITPARVSQALHTIANAYDAIIHKGVNLPLSIIQSVTSQRQLLEDTIANLEVVVSSRTANEVEALIAYDTLPWNFAASSRDSVAIDIYRAQAVSVDHTTADTVDWACPQFFSAVPIPMNSRASYSMNVRLPSDGDESHASIPRFVHLTFNERDTPQSLIKQAMTKGQLRHSAHANSVNDVMNDWTMKCIGSEEFAHSDRSILDHEFIRSAVRQHEDVQVVIVRRSLRQQAEEAETSINHSLPDQYMEKVNPMVEPITLAHYTMNAASESSWLTAQFLSVHENQFPLRFRILGLDHLNEATINKLEQTLFTAFHVRCFFFHGANKVDGSERTTPEFAYLSQPRFNQMLSFPHLTYNTVPREMRVAFVLYGRRADETTPVMLAYVTKPLVDERGLFAQGQMTYRLWPAASVKGKKHSAKDKDGSVLSEAMLMHACPVENYAERECCTITVKWDEWALPLLYPLALPPHHIAVPPPQPQSNSLFHMLRAGSAPVNGQPHHLIPNKAVQKQLDELIAKDVLYAYTSTELALLHMYRQHLSKQPQALIPFLLSVNWLIPDARYDAYELLSTWATPYQPVAAMMMLDARFADTKVRQYAITILRRLTDAELALYLLQLVQCIKYECFHWSALSAFLIERATANPITVGIPLFWHLKCELHASAICERFALILEEILSFSPRLAHELRKQQLVMHQLQRVSELVQRWTRDPSGAYSDAYIAKEYAKEMNKLNAELLGPIGGFRSPLHPKVRVTTLCVDKCRYMSSKMVPLWLVFSNADPFVRAQLPNTRTSGSHNSLSHTRQSSMAFNNSQSINIHATTPSSNGISAPKQSEHPREYIYMIFKSGDDLRQDILTLQMLRLMDTLWLSQGLDLRLQPYQVVATGVNEHNDGIGLIEVVMNSDTTSRIQVKYGGKALGALNKEALDRFIREHNTGIVHGHSGHSHHMEGGARSSYDLAVENFVHSCAGYLVATFVLGIGDRHNGNIMLTKKGHLFHIDFGHFLGNFKSKFGINRERAAFVFTPEMAFVMGGKNAAHYRHFLALSSHAFKVLRANVSLLEIMFLLMVSAGMPELQSHSDIAYMSTQLHLDCTEAKAERKLWKEIEKSLNSTYRRFDNAIHNWKHGG